MDREAADKRQKEKEAQSRLLVEYLNAQENKRTKTDMHPTTKKKKKKNIKESYETPKGKIQGFGDQKLDFIYQESDFTIYEIKENLDSLPEKFKKSKTLVKRNSIKPDKKNNNSIAKYHNHIKNKKSYYSEGSSPELSLIVPSTPTDPNNLIDFDLNKHPKFQDPLNSCKSQDTVIVKNTNEVNSFYDIVDESNFKELLKSKTKINSNKGSQSNFLKHSYTSIKDPDELYESNLMNQYNPVYNNTDFRLILAPVDYTLPFIEISKDSVSFSLKNIKNKRKSSKIEKKKTLNTLDQLNQRYSPNISEFPGSNFPKSSPNNRYRPDIIEIPMENKPKSNVYTSPDERFISKRDQKGENLIEFEDFTESSNITQNITKDPIPLSFTPTQNSDIIDKLSQSNSPVSEILAKKSDNLFRSNTTNVRTFRKGFFNAILNTEETPHQLVTPDRSYEMDLQRYGRNTVCGDISQGSLKDSYGDYITKEDFVNKMLVNIPSTKVFLKESPQKKKAIYFRKPARRLNEEEYKQNLRGRLTEEYEKKLANS
jgi:hypothetical protein